MNNFGFGTDGNLIPFDVDGDVIKLKLGEKKELNQIKLDF